ncbi:hypothetical protein NB716_004114 [Pantoea ananatis]|nr:hypothetical protein [Pantoea ananatis]
MKINISLEHYLQKLSRMFFIFSTLHNLHNFFLMASYKATSRNYEKNIVQGQLSRLWIVENLRHHVHLSQNIYAFTDPHRCFQAPLFFSLEEGTF